MSYVQRIILGRNKVHPHEVTASAGPGDGPDEDAGAAGRQQIVAPASHPSAVVSWPAPP